MKNFDSSYSFGHSIKDSGNEENLDGWVKVMSLFCRFNGELVGLASLQWNPDKHLLFPDIVGVHPDFRRKGIANTLYQNAERLTGSKITRPEDHSDDAEKFWNQPNRQWGSEVL